MPTKKGQILSWALDALKVTLAWLTYVYISPKLEEWFSPIPELLIEFSVILIVVFVGNILLNILFGLPQITILWNDPEKNEVSGAELHVTEGELGVHSMQAVYKCQTSLAKRINTFLARHGRLVIEFDPSAVRVTPDIGFTRVGTTLDANRGRLIMPLNSTVENGTVTWCAVQIEPLSVPDGYKGAIKYRIDGQGKAMVFWGWVIRPSTSVRTIHVSRS